jgi:hypothetical protein
LGINFHITYDFICKLRSYHSNAVLKNHTFMKRLSIILLGLINVAHVFTQKQNIILVGGRMDPQKGGNELLPKNPNSQPAAKPVYNTNQPQVVALTSGTFTGKNGAVLFKPPASRRKVDVVTTDASKAPKLTVNNATDNNEGLTDNNNSSISGLLDNSNTNSNNNLTTSQPTNANQYAGGLLESVSTAPVKVEANNNSNFVNKSLVETVDPSLMKSNSLQNKINANIKSVNNNTREQANLSTNVYNTTVNSNKPKMPELAPIGVQTSQKASSLKMPELAPIDGQSIKIKATSLMPELAPIEGQEDKKNQPVMPELAPIEDGNKPVVELLQETNSAKVKTNLRGFTMPKGTSMIARTGRSFLFQPAIPVVDTIDEIKNSVDEQMNSKPSAGGGMGMIALAPIETTTEKKSNAMPALAPIESSIPILETSSTTTLKPINSQQGQPAKQLYTPTAPRQQQPQMTVPCQHVHAVNCPCCNAGKKVYTAPKKKWTAKKRYYPKPVYNTQPDYYTQPVYKSEVTQVYQQQDPNRTRITERIVYVPMNQRTAQKQVAQTQQYQAPAKQERVVYRDYTNAYNKQQAVQQNNQPSNANKYYDPKNYAPGLSAGPTSGDYPASGNSSNVDMQYSFYLNKRGKYSVGVYNYACSITLSQDGKIKEYKINADPKVDPKYYKPKLNFFGSPENVAGIPIEYNYNRTVHKIGDVVFEYDFEGFFEKVGTSTVYYTSRSSISQVDGINVHYDPNNDVASVDPNNGLIQFNP